MITTGSRANIQDITHGICGNTEKLIRVSYAIWNEKVKVKEETIKLKDLAQSCLMGSVASRATNITCLFCTDQTLEQVAQRGVEFPSLKMFKNCLDAILCPVLWDNPA